MITAAGFEKMLQYTSYFERGVVYTVFLSACAVAIGFVLALLLALMRLSRIKPLRWLSGAYIEIIRGTPMLVQLYIVYFGVFGAITVPSFTIFGFMDSARFIPGVVAVGLNSGGYLAEVIRGGIQDVDIGQTEAARSLGLTQSQNMRYIVLPQAIKYILPAIANEFVTIIKESSICSVLGMQDIIFNAQLIQSSSWRILEPLIVAAALYFCMTFITSKIIGAVERRMRRGDIR
jgi:His/Glu/Gln/Arg/opine family amino acid ABC transporter permease subunit